MKIHINELVCKEIECIKEILRFVENGKSLVYLRVRIIDGDYYFDLPNTFLNTIDTESYLSLDTSLIHEYLHYNEYKKKKYNYVS